MKTTINLLLLAALSLSLAPCRLYSFTKADSVEFDKPPVAISQVQPKYPDAAMSENIEGTVYLKVFVDREGAVRDVSVIKSDSKVFEQPSIDAIRQWRFTPALLQDKPVDAWIAVPFRFKLKDRESASATPPEAVYFDSAPVAISQVQPKYPDAALKGNVEGMVHLNVCVDKEGRVRDATVRASDNPLFEQPSIDAVKQWRFTPAKLRNEPVEVWVDIPFRFRLANNDK